jgi:hypothetical protein
MPGRLNGAAAGFTPGDGAALMPIAVSSILDTSNGGRWVAIQQGKVAYALLQL